MLSEKVKSETITSAGKHMIGRLTEGAAFVLFTSFQTVKHEFFYSFFARITLIKTTAEAILLVKDSGRNTGAPFSCVPP